MALACSPSEAHLSLPCAGPTRGTGLHGAHSGPTSGRHGCHVLWHRLGSRLREHRGRRLGAWEGSGKLQGKLTTPLGFEREEAEHLLCAGKTLRNGTERLRSGKPRSGALPEAMATARKH